MVLSRDDELAANIEDRRSRDMAGRRNMVQDKPLGSDLRFEIGQTLDHIASRSLAQGTNKLESLTERSKSSRTMLRIPSRVQLVQCIGAMRGIRRRTVVSFVLVCILSLVATFTNGVHIFSVLSARRRSQFR